MSKNYTFGIQKSVFAFAAITLFRSTQVYAQLDAGALQQGLEQQLPLPSPLALPQPERGASGPKAQAKEGEVRFTVNQFDEGFVSFQKINPDFLICDIDLNDIDEQEIYEYAEQIDIQSMVKKYNIF